MKPTRPPNGVKPEARINFAGARWWHPPFLPNPMYPDGMPGLLVIESEPRVGTVFMVLPVVADGALAGWQLVKSDGTVYHVEDGKHGLHCQCPDSTFRKRPCRHVLALQHVLADVIDHERPAWRSAAEAAEHADPFERGDFDPAA